MITWRIRNVETTNRIFITILSMKHESQKNIGYLITKCSHIWNQELISEFKKFWFYDQKPSFWAILIPLFDKWYQSIGDIIEFSWLTKQTISIYQKELEALWYITKEKDEKDKRKLIIILTKKWEELKKIAEKAAINANKIFFNKLWNKDFKVLTKLLVKCIENN